MGLEGVRVYYNACIIWAEVCFIWGYRLYVFYRFVRSVKSVKSVKVVRVRSVKSVNLCRLVPSDAVWFRLMSSGSV